tara:strand:- start:564 stop:1205 length:642 start_codon:yes stop_codon:yes gene_type:complete
MAKAVAKRKFAPVPKNRKGTPLKYLEGLSASEKKAKEAEMKRTAKKAREGTLTKAEMDRISKERAARGMKKGGSAKKGGGGTPACVKKHAKSSGKSVSTLNKVYKRGLGAYYSSGSRNVPASAWACGRVRSFATGKGGARKADADLLKKKTGGSVEFDAKKSDLNKDGKISKYERKRGEAIARNMRNGGMVELQARGCGAMMNAKRKTTRVPK